METEGISQLLTPKSIPGLITRHGLRLECRGRRHDLYGCADQTLRGPAVEKQRKSQLNGGMYYFREGSNTTGDHGLGL